MLPFMELLSKQNAIAESSQLTWAYEFFAFETERSFLIATGVFVLSVISLSSVLAIVTTYAQHKISWIIAHKKAMGLLKVYADKPYSFYLGQNTSELRAYLIAEVSNLISGVITPLIEFISRAIVCITIFSLLLIISPWITIRVFLILGVIYIIIYLSRQNFLKKLGKLRVQINVNRYRFLEEMLTGIKTVKMYGAKDHFSRRYEAASKAFSDIQPKVKMVYATPKYILEMLAFGGILAVTLIAYMNYGDITKVLPRLTLYAVAGYKLLPALQLAFSSISKVRHNMPSLDLLYDDLILSKNYTPAKEEPTGMRFEKSIQVSELSFAYENAKSEVLQNLNLTIQKGATVAFVGPTGSGKTTLIDVLTGLLQPTGGEILVDDVRLTVANIDGWQKRIAYVPQEVFLYDDTVKANIAFGAGNEEVDLDRLDQAMKMAEIFDLVYDELPKGIETMVGEQGVRLSGGQRQRIGLARALYRNPSVLILDEATSALDNITEKNISSSLKTLPQNLTIIVIAHRLSTVRDADTIFLLENGKIIQNGSYNELLDNNDLFKKLVEYS